MFSLDRLRALAAAAAHGSTASAARELHITPSALSQQLNKLERESGHQLLEPHGRSIRFTHAGRVLAAHANEMMRCAAAAEADLFDLQSEVIGPLRIGAVGSAIRGLVTAALTTLAREHPRLAPTVRDGEVVDMLPDLLAGDLDLVVVDSWQGRPLQLAEGLATQTLTSEEADIALSTRHPLTEYECLELTQLDGIAWTSCPPGTEPYESLVQLLRSHGLEPDIRYTVSEYATQFALVGANLAAALIPAMVQREAPPDVRFVRCETSVRREIKAAWKARTAGPLVRTCLESLKDAARP